jgi:MFS family permease
MSRLRAFAVDLSPLREREFRLLWTARGISTFGTTFTFVAVPFQVYAITGSSLAVGMLGLVELVALLSLSFLGGALADAVDRRRLVRGTEAALLVCALALAANAALDDPHLWVLYVVAGLMAGLGAVQRPALEATIPRVVPKEQLAAATALRGIQSTSLEIVGPAVAGVLLASAGASWTFVVDAASYAVGVVALARMRAVPPPDDAERPSVARVLEGLRYARRRRDLLGTYTVDMIAMFFGMPLALFPAIAVGLGGPEVLGLLYTAPAVGALVASAGSGWMARVHRHGLAITAAACVWGLGIVAFGLADSLVPALLALAVAGGADMVSAIFRMTMWNETIPDGLRGRLAAIEQISYTSGPLLGNVEAGVAASLVGVEASIVLGGALCVAGVVAAASALPAFLTYDRAVVG